MKILKNSIIYSVVSILQKAFSFFLLPLYTAVLSTSDYGIISIVMALINLLSIFFLFSLHGALGRFYYDRPNDEKYKKELFGTIFFVVLIISIGLGTILIIFHDFVITPFIKNVPFFPYILIGLITVIVSPIYTLFQTVLQTKQEGFKLGINNFLFFVCNIGLTILFVVGFKWGALGFLLAFCITNIVFFISSVLLFIPKIKPTINKEILGQSFKYALPLMPHTLSSWIVAMLDRFFINNYKNNDAVGIYSIGYQFGNILNIITSAVNQAFVPWFFDKMQKNDENENRKIVQFSEYMVTIYCLIALFLSLFSTEILSILVTAKFRSGGAVIPFISFSFVFGGLYYFYVAPLYFNKKATKFMPISTLSGAFLGVILNIILIPALGILGAALANLTSNFLITLLVLIFMIKASPLRFRFIKQYIFIFISFGVSMMTFLNGYMNTSLLFILKVGALCALVLFVAIHYRKEIVVLRELLTRRVKNADPL